MAKTPATHSGECQVCGSRQLLPAGVLSLHGYTVQWSFFNGICSGARHLPFEQSKDLIEASIERARQGRTAQKALAAQLRQPVPADATAAWVRVFHGSTKYGSDYRWHLVELTRTEKVIHDTTYANFTYPNPAKDGQTVGFQGYEVGYNSTYAEAIAKLNERKATEVHDALVKQLTAYIKWQQDRIANWAPKPLTPAPPEKRNKGPLAHARNVKYPQVTLCHRRVHGFRGQSAHLAQDASDVTCPKCTEKLAGTN